MTRKLASAKRDGESIEKLDEGERIEREKEKRETYNENADSRSLASKETRQHGVCLVTRRAQQKREERPRVSGGRSEAGSSSSTRNGQRLLYIEFRIISTFPIFFLILFLFSSSFYHLLHFTSVAPPGE